MLKSSPYLTIDQVNHWGEFIDSTDVYDHLLSCHNYTGNDLFKDESWAGYGILQGPKTIDRQKLNDQLLKNHGDTKPLYAQETLWPGNKYHPGYSLDDIRKNAFVILMSASMINFADMNGNSSSGFSGELDPDQINPEIHREINRIWDFFENIPFYDLNSHQELVDKGYCLAQPGEYYLIYLPDGGRVKVGLPLKIFEAGWINAQNTGLTEKIGKVKGESVFNAPDNNDWLLLINNPDK